jgi:hypothetical protein
MTAQRIFRRYGYLPVLLFLAGAAGTVRGDIDAVSEGARRGIPVTRTVPFASGLTGPPQIGPRCVDAFQAVSLPPSLVQQNG